LGAWFPSINELITLFQCLIESFHHIFCNLAGCQWVASESHCSVLSGGSQHGSIALAKAHLHIFLDSSVQAQAAAS
jgi:hypothetical protein